MILPHLSRKTQVQPAYSSYQQDFSFTVASEHKPYVSLPKSKGTLLRAMNFKLSAFYSPKPHAEISRFHSPCYNRKAFGFAEFNREKQNKRLRLESLKGQGEMFRRESQRKLHKKAAAEALERQYGVSFSELEVIELSFEQLEKQARLHFVSKVTNRAAKIIQRYWASKKISVQKKAFIARMHLSAAKIQRAWKRSAKFLSRKSAPEQAVVVIQKLWRGVR